MKYLTSAATLLAIGLALPASASAQTSLFTPDVSGRASSEFWDNLSADGEGCNVGYFALGTFSNTCLNETAGTFANSVGNNYQYYFNNGTGGPTALPINPLFGYNVELTLVGSVAGGMSEIGWFYLDNSNYIFNPIAAFGSKQINSTFVFSPSTQWGLYIANNFNNSPGGCFDDAGPTDYDCSDATGGFTSVPFQQFALFSDNGLNRFTDRYLWGVEDNMIETLGGTIDGDYNDYMIAMQFSAVPEPATMGLLATGLVGLVGAGLVKRRRGTNA